MKPEVVAVSCRGRWVKVSAEELGWSLVREREGLSGLPHNINPAPHGFGEGLVDLSTISNGSTPRLPKDQYFASWRAIPLCLQIPAHIGPIDHRKGLEVKNSQLQNSTFM